jgi:hypothetical protein
MVATPETLYLYDQDIFRVGTSTSPKLDKVRPVDMVTYERNGILMVRATGVGVSLGTIDYLQKLQFSGWLWKIPPTAVFPQGLFLQPDLSPNKQGHFFLCPVSDMPMDKYRGLLAELALHCERSQKI